MERNATNIQQTETWWTCPRPTITENTVSAYPPKYAHTMIQHLILLNMHSINNVQCWIFHPARINS